MTDSLAWWAMAIAIGLCVGFAKTGIPGLGILAVPMMAYVIPNKESVGTLLPLLILADMFAIAYYRAHTDWKLIGKLFPWIAAGFIPGALFLQHIDDALFLPVLGALVLGMLALDLLRQAGKVPDVAGHPIIGSACGIITGFATTVGNAAGPIMTVYLQSYDKNRFMGSMAWLFFLVNVAKIPMYLILSVREGTAMINATTLRIDLYLAPAVIVGCLLGRPILRRLPEVLFRRAVLVLVFAAAIKLLFN